MFGLVNRLAWRRSGKIIFNAIARNRVQVFTLRFTLQELENFNARAKNHCHFLRVSWVQSIIWSFPGAANLTRFSAAGPVVNSRSPATNSKQPVEDRRGAQMDGVLLL